jgi:2-furoyl-CoA dehydrogenase 2Fe-2S iron sulfur subunit
MRRVNKDQKARISLTLNGRKMAAEAEPRMLLSDFLRHSLGATGTHVGCEHGVCGCCTVQIDGAAVRSCLTLAMQAEGRDVKTVESLAGPNGKLNKLQQAFQNHHALQCGFCTPGILMSFTDFLARNPKPTEEELREVLSGHICRCTGYAGIMAALKEAAGSAELERGNERTDQERRDAAGQAGLSRAVTIGGKNVVLAHNEPPVINAGVLEMAEIFRMFNIFDEKFSPSNIDKADGTPLRLYTSDRVKVDVSKRRKHDMGFWHRNIDAHEIIFCVKGALKWETEMGVKIMHPGDMLFIPKGIGHRSMLCEDSTDDNVLIELKIAMIWLMSARITRSKTFSADRRPHHQRHRLADYRRSAAPHHPRRGDCGAGRQDRWRSANRPRSPGPTPARRRSTAATRWRRPGFVDCHLHSSFQLSRGLADEANAQSFLFDRMYPYEAALDADDVRVSATLAATELLKHGVTCFIDPGNYHPESSVEGVMSTGIRMVVSRSSFDLTKSVLGLCPSG